MTVSEVHPDLCGILQGRGGVIIERLPSLQAIAKAQNTLKRILSSRHQLDHISKRKLRFTQVQTDVTSYLHKKHSAQTGNLASLVVKWQVSSKQLL